MKYEIFKRGYALVETMALPRFSTYLSLMFAALIGRCYPLPKAHTSVFYGNYCCFRFYFSYPKMINRMQKRHTTAQIFLILFA
jgi:hypothetical protein